MKILPYLAIFAFVAGISMLGYGYFYAGDGTQAQASRPVEVFDRTPPAPTESPTASPTNLPTATPTPAPFDGRVGRLELARLGISNAIEEVGLIANTNELDTPHDAVNKVGWY